MPEILITPAQLRGLAEDLRGRAKRIQTACQQVDQRLMPLRGEKFLGRRAEALQNRYHKLREALLGYHLLAARLADTLEEAARLFEKADAAPAAPTRPANPPPVCPPELPALAKTPQESWAAWLQRGLGVGADAGALGAILQNAAETGALTPTDQFSVALTLTQYFSGQPELAQAAEQANLLLSAKEVTLGLLTRNPAAGVYFAMADVLLHSDRWTPAVDSFAQWASGQVFAALTQAAQVFLDGVDLMDLATLPMDELLYPELATPQRREKAAAARQGLQQFFADLRAFQ